MQIPLLMENFDNEMAQQRSGLLFGMKIDGSAAQDLLRIGGASFALGIESGSLNEQIQKEDYFRLSQRTPKVRELQS
jgi:hypothetical protein